MRAGQGGGLSPIRPDVRVEARWGRREGVDLGGCARRAGGAGRRGRGGGAGALRANRRRAGTRPSPARRGGAGRGARGLRAPVGVATAPQRPAGPPARLAGPVGSAPQRRTAAARDVVVDLGVAEAGQPRGQGRVDRRWGQHLAGVARAGDPRPTFRGPADRDPRIQQVAARRQGRGLRRERFATRPRPRRVGVDGAFVAVARGDVDPALGRGARVVHGEAGGGAVHDLVFEVAQVGVRGGRTEGLDDAARLLGVPRLERFEDVGHARRPVDRQRRVAQRDEADRARPLDRLHGFFAADRRVVDLDRVIGRVGHVDQWSVFVSGHGGFAEHRHAVAVPETAGADRFDQAPRRVVHRHIGALVHIEAVRRPVDGDPGGDSGVDRRAGAVYGARRQREGARHVPRDGSVVVGDVEVAFRIDRQAAGAVDRIGRAQLGQVAERPGEGVDRVVVVVGDVEVAFRVDREPAGAVQVAGRGRRFGRGGEDEERVVRGRRGGRGHQAERGQHGDSESAEQASAAPAPHINDWIDHAVVPCSVPAMHASVPVHDLPRAYLARTVARPPRDRKRGRSVSLRERPSRSPMCCGPAPSVPLRPRRWFPPRICRRRRLRCPLGRWCRRS